MKINNSVRSLLTFVLFIVFIPAFSQPPKPCGKQVINLEAQEKAEQFMAQMSSRALAVNRMVRVYFHICFDTDGSNAAATAAQIQTEFNQLVADYVPNQLCFANMGADSIYSTQINTMVNPGVPSSYAAYALFLVPGCINIFYQASLANGDGGNAYAIPNTFCSITRGNIGFQRTISHEVGHCLGLSHTFAGGDENINGSNCSTAGDRVCDTPADPYSFRDSSCFTNTNCLYTGNCPDPNGATNYTPPYNNIMSYWEQLSCNRIVFTAGQFTRVNGFLDSNVPLQNTQCPANVVYGPITATNGLLLNAAIFDFTTNGAVILQSDVTAMLQGRIVTLNPGFRATPTTGKVDIKASACSY